jgi:3-phenylpropionate/trans-cinnamate dioxygenase ferredoxin component
MSRWVAACSTDEVKPEDVMAFRRQGIDYAIYRSGDDEFFATAGHCTHEETLLCEGLVTDGIIECPLHYGRFEYRTGRALGAPVFIDLRTFPVKVEDGTVYIDIE